MWVVRLSDKQLEVVRAVLRSEEHRGPALEGALEEGTDGGGLEEDVRLALGVQLLAAQGVSEADVIWDRCGRHVEPAVPPIRSKPRRAKRKGKAPGGKQAA